MPTDPTRWEQKRARLLARREQLRADLAAADRKVRQVHAKIAAVQAAITDSERRMVACRHGDA